MKIKCEEYFYTGIPHWPAEDCAITNQLTMSAHSRQSEQRNIIDRTHTWQQCSVTISEDILTIKYGFNLRFHRYASITNSIITWNIFWLETIYRAYVNRSAQSQSWHTFEAKHATLSGMISKGPGKQSKRYECQLLRKANTVWRNPGMTTDDVCLMFTWALKIAPGFPLHVGNKTR